MFLLLALRIVIQMFDNKKEKKLGEGSGYQSVDVSAAHYAANGSVWPLGYRIGFHFLLTALTVNRILP